MKVVILCAGRGSRLGETTNNFPKALVTINNKPILGHILDHLYSGCSFDLEPEISIAIGYKGEFIKNYVSWFYPDKAISFVNVDKFQGISTGPGYSLLQMSEFVKDDPFILVLGDTLCFDDLVKIVKEDNCICVSKVNESSRFTTCSIDADNRVVEFFDKVIDAPSKFAIIGVYYIKDSQLYFEGLEKTKDILIDNELQISNGFNYLLKNGKKILALQSNWKDTGIKETLMSTRAALGDFTVSDSSTEINIIQSDKSRKYLSESEYRVYKRYYSAIMKINTGSLFKNVLFENNGSPLSLDFSSFEGQKSLYSIISNSIDVSNTAVILFRVLKDINDNLYSTTRIKANKNDIDNIYRCSVIDGLRSDVVLKEYIAGGKFLLNGLEMNDPVGFLSDLDLNLLMPDYYVPIHGNLSINNIFYDLKTEKVNLINSKMWFGESFIYGDLAYDLAFLMKSLAPQYRNIRLNNFMLDIDDDNNFRFEVERDIFLDLLKEKYCELVSNLFDDKVLIKRVNLLESILFFKNAIGVNAPKQKLAYFFAGINLLNIVANCEFIAK